MARQLTLEQAAAIHLRGISVGLTAGAGSGKTTVLTDRLLRDLDIAQGSAGLMRVVAMTYTDRAAREMKDRVREKCYELMAGAAPEDMEAWQSLISSLDLVRISTIHSFCQALLRNHALELGLDPQFQILDEAIAGGYLQQSIDEVLMELIEARDPDVMHLLQFYELHTVKNHLAMYVRNRFRIRLEEFLQRTTVEWAEEYERYYRGEYLPTILQEIMGSNAYTQIHALLKEHEPESPKLNDRRKILLQEFASIESPLDLAARMETIRENTNLAGAGNKKYQPDEVQESLKEHFGKLKKDFIKYTDATNIEPELFLEAAEWAQRFARITEKVNLHFAQLKQTVGAFDFDDLLLQTRDFLRENTAVCQKVAQGIDLLLVDEFQDTDPIQLDIVRLLCSADLKHGKLFAVGDVKQSIYRFRRADPTLFLQLKQELPPAGRLSMAMNFRSQPFILHFVNILFSRGMGEDYVGLTTIKKQISPQPCIEFLFPRISSTGRVKVGQLRQEEAGWIAARIKAMLQDRTPRIRTTLPDRTEGLRRVELGDIVLLFQSLTNIADYERALQSLDLDYYLVGGHAFFAQQEISDLANLCLAIADPWDEIALIGVLRSPFFNIDDQTLFLICHTTTSGHTRRKPLSEALFEPYSVELLAVDQRARVERAAALIQELRQRKDHVSLHEVLHTAITETGYDASLLWEPLGSRKLANLKKLISQAEKFHAHGFSMRDFALHLRESVLDETKEKFAATSPEVGNTIRIMTIHQSKGLEFPVVFVVDINRARQSDKQTAVLHADFGAIVEFPKDERNPKSNPVLQMFKYREKKEEEAQSLRLFYVATTRAKDHLILSAGLSCEKPSPSLWMKTVQDCFNIDTGLPNRDPVLGSLLTGIDSQKQIPQIKVHPTKPTWTKDPNTASNDHVSLLKLPEVIEAATAEEFPALSRPLTIDRDYIREISVSQIEVLAEDKSVSHSHLDHGEDEDEELSRFNLSADDKTLLGELTHAVLQYRPYSKPDPLTLSQRILRTARLFRVDHRDEFLFAAQKRLTKFLDSDVYQQLQTANECYSELDFRLPWKIERSKSRVDSPYLTINGSIDLLASWSPDKYWIIDFKTGKLPENPKQLTQIYGVQMYLYHRVMQETYGHPPEKILLIEMSTRFRVHDLTAVIQQSSRIEATIQDILDNLHLQPAT
jgi:ATP-dependent helicase/nuclease subunit A